MRYLRKTDDIARRNGIRYATVKEELNMRRNRWLVLKRMKDNGTAQRVQQVKITTKRVRGTTTQTWNDSIANILQETEEMQNSQQSTSVIDIVPTSNITYTLTSQTKHS